jgi:hypothetical protein
MSISAAHDLSSSGLSKKGATSIHPRNKFPGQGRTVFLSNF